MGFNLNSFLSSIFGNKATRDIKAIKPLVDKVLAAYPEIEKLDNDQLRAKTDEIKAYIQEQVVDLKKEIEELSKKIEQTEIDQRQPIFDQIDKIEEKVLEKYEEALNEVMPTVFAIVKDTARRFTQNSEVVVTATDFDRELAASRDFVRIEGDKAIWSNH